MDCKVETKQLALDGQYYPAEKKHSFQQQLAYQLVHEAGVEAHKPDEQTGPEHGIHSFEQKWVSLKLTLEGSWCCLVVTPDLELGKVSKTRTCTL